MEDKQSHLQNQKLCISDNNPATFINRVLTKGLLDNSRVLKVFKTSSYVFMTCKTIDKQKHIS